MNETAINWKCPICGKSYFTDSGGMTTLMQFPVIWKDGENIPVGSSNADGNITHFNRSCMKCGTSFMMVGEHIIASTKEDQVPAYTCGDCIHFVETDVIGGLGFCRADRAWGVSIHPKNEACKYKTLLAEKKENKMPDCTCKCGHHRWIIYPGYMKCVKCGKEYNLPDIIQKPVCFDVSKFNKEVKER